MPKNSYSQGAHGGEVYKAAARLGLKPRQILDFSSNANVFGIELTQDIVNSAPYPFLHYPESENISLREAIARHEGATYGNVICGNGAADLIWQFLRFTAPRSVMLLGPAFSEYARACRALGINYTVITPSAEFGFACGEEDLRRIWESSAELAILCTPNNPAGITYENMHAILAVLRSPRLLVDLSYREFIYDSPLYAQNCWNEYTRLANPGTAVFTLHSFTKFFCCPGIRLGYMLGDARSVRLMQDAQPAWSISTFVQNAGIRFLEYIKEYRDLLPQIRLAAYHLGLELRRLPIFDPDYVFEGPNFFCCRLSGNASGAIRRSDGKAPEAADLQDFLLHHRILVRNCDNIPGMPAGFIRLQVRPGEDNQKLLDILQKA